MASRKERIEISIIGGRPWGFSLKGGQESDKPLMISKVWVDYVKINSFFEHQLVIG